MIRHLWLLAALGCLMATRPAVADFLSISPAGTVGPGGTITFSEIGTVDPTSANVNTDHTSRGIIPVTFTASNTAPLAIFGNAVNDTDKPWNRFVATIVAGDATFRAPNDPFDPHGTYTDTPGWMVAITNQGRTANFLGSPGSHLMVGDSLDVFLGLDVASTANPFTIHLSGVPEPSGLTLAVIGLAILGGQLARRRWARVAVLVLAGLVALTPATAPAAGPQVVAAYQKSFTLQAVGQVPAHPSQMVFGPSGLLYVMCPDAGPISFQYDKATGDLTAPVQAAPTVQGIGIAFHGNAMYLTALDGTLHKLEDSNGNGVWGESGELDVAIVTGIPQGDHNTDQLQIIGKTLYVGIGRRTVNGHLGAWTSGQLDDLGGAGFYHGGIGRTYGDSAYNGTIAWIRDLTAVVDQTGSANAWTTEPPLLTPTLIQHDAGPFTTQDPGKLVVHSAGTRNPFGLCQDADGNLWFTNNFNRTATLGNGQAGFGLRGDQLDADFSLNVQDQLFQASPGADYGYTDANWRGVNPMMNPRAKGYHRVLSTTFDNLFNKGPYVLHDPANPDGLGPSSSADGCSFAYSSLLPGELQGNIFIARYNGTITEVPGGAQRSITYSDLVAVDVSTGKVRQIASGFQNPLAVLADDPAGRILIADYGDQVVYTLQAVPLP